MKYLKTLNERIASALPVTDDSEDAIDSAEEVIGSEKDPTNAEAEEVSNDTEIVSPDMMEDDLDTGGIKDATWEAVMEGPGDYELSFKNLEGASTTCVFKDTGNRRMDGSADMSAAFVGIPGTSGDSKNYVAEALMKKNPEGNYEIQSFVVYEH